MSASATQGGHKQERTLNYQKRVYLFRSQDNKDALKHLICIYYASFMCAIC